MEGGEARVGHRGRRMGPAFGRKRRGEAEPGGRVEKKHAGTAPARKVAAKKRGDPGEKGGRVGSVKSPGVRIEGKKLGH